MLRFDPVRFLKTSAELIRPVASELDAEPALGRPYGHLLLMGGDGWELNLCRWRPGARTAPHDHGGAEGLVMLLDGRLHERRYRFEGDELIRADSAVLEAPRMQALEVDDIHDVEALEGGHSLHLYWGGSGSFEVFDLARRRRLTLAEGGAWLPEDPSEALAIRAW